MMKTKYKNYLKIFGAAIAVFMGFVYAESFANIKAFLLSIFIAFFASVFSYGFTEMGVEEFEQQSQYAHFQAQMIRFGIKWQRIKYYLIATFVTFGSTFLLSLSSVHNCISLDGIYCEKQENLLYKLFMVTLVPCLIGVRLAIGEAGIKGKCSYCNSEFVALEHLREFDCVICKKKLSLEEGSFEKII